MTHAPHAPHCVHGTPCPLVAMRSAPGAFTGRPPRPPPAGPGTHSLGRGGSLGLRRCRASSPCSCRWDPSGIACLVCCAVSAFALKRLSTVWLCALGRCRCCGCCCWPGAPLFLLTWWLQDPPVLEPALEVHVARERPLRSLCFPRTMPRGWGAVVPLCPARAVAVGAQCSTGCALPPPAPPA